MQKVMKVTKRSVGKQPVWEVRIPAQVARALGEPEYLLLEFDGEKVTLRPFPGEQPTEPAAKPHYEWQCKKCGKVVRGGTLGATVFWAWVHMLSTHGEAHISEIEREIEYVE